MSHIGSPPTGQVSPSTAAIEVAHKTSVGSYDPKEGAAITPLEYGGLQEAFDHFNAALFDGALPDVFITYQRCANSSGYFSPNRYSGRIGNLGKHELALNPDGFIGETDEQICSTIVHEMVHLWQHAFGKPSPRGYHNREWAAKMKAIGLQPSSTGMVGGKETGQRMSDYVIPDGPFTRAFAKLAANGWKLNLQSAHRANPKTGGNNSKTKFSCLRCGFNSWAKPDGRMTCAFCYPGAPLMVAAPISSQTTESDSAAPYSREPPSLPAPRTDLMIDALEVDGAQ
jgi:hypothetical protein